MRLLSIRSLWTIVFLSSLLVIVVGLSGIALPYAQADVLVPLVRETPGNEAYSLVAAQLSNGLRTFYSVFIVLGLLISICSWIGYQKSGRVNVE